MFGLGTTELLIIGVIVFLIFGAKRLPEIGKGLGGALREFRQIKKNVKDEERANDGKEVEGREKAPPALEEKLVQKVAEQIPGVKKVVEVKKKIEKAKDILE